MLLVTASVFSSGCGSGQPDYTKVQAQTGGPEQGTWQSKATRLDLSSGKFTLKNQDGSVSGTYTVNGSSISLMEGGGQALSAQFPDPNGPLTLNGETLQKTD